MKKIIGFVTLLSFLVNGSAEDWTAGTGDWNTGSNWSGGTVPVAGQQANIFNGGTATISSSPPSTFVNNNAVAVQIGGSSGAGTLTQTAGIYNAGNVHVGAGGNNLGTLNISGGQFNPRYINIGNAGVGIVNHTGGSISTTSWAGIATSSGGRGTYNISGTGVFNGGNLEVSPRGGDGVLNVSGDADVRVSTLLFDHHGGASLRSEVNLDGGNISVNNIRLEDDAGGGASTFNWGSGTLRRRDTITGAQGGFAVNGPGGEDPQRGATLNMYSNGNDAFASLTTGSSINIPGGGSSVLDLGGFFKDNGTRFGVLTLEGSLDLSSNNDTIMFGSSDNFLSPFGIGNSDWGSLTLIQAAQGITSEFNTFDFQGSILKRYNGAFTIPASLPVNTYYPEYTANELIFHYRAGGTVPEPSTMTMVLVGFVFVRALRRRYVKFMD